MSLNKTQNSDESESSDDQQEVEVSEDEKQIIEKKSIKKPLDETLYTKTGRKKRPSKIDPVKGDMRKVANIQNLVKARAARLARLEAAKLAAANQYEVCSSSDDDEIILSKKHKPKIITKDEERILKLELMLEKYILQEQEKNKRPPKEKRVIQIQLPQPVVKEPSQELVNLKKKFLLDL
jgi:hypothetical protein